MPKHMISHRWAQTLSRKDALTRVETVAWSIAIVATILGLVLATMAPLEVGEAGAHGGVRSAPGDESGLYFPIALKQPSPTPTPTHTLTPGSPMVELTIQNDLDCPLLLTLRGPAEYDWSVSAHDARTYTIVAGTYDRSASTTCCGGTSDTVTITEDDTWTFWCGFAQSNEVLETSPPNGAKLLDAGQPGLSPLTSSTQGPNVPGPGFWQSGFTIQNLGRGIAHAMVDIINENGNTVATFSKAIAAGQSDFTFVSNLSIPDGRYSVVISSDEPVVGITNLTSQSPTTAGAYGGFTLDQVSTTLYAPGVYKEYYGFGSNVVVQNAGLVDANVEVQYFDTSGNVVGTEAATVKPGASRVFNQAAAPTLPSGFIGSAVIRSTNGQNLAAEVNVWSSSGQGLFSIYNAFNGGSTVAHVPVLMNNYYGFVTALTVMCVDDEPCDVRVIYSTGHRVTCVIPPWTTSGCVLFQPSDPGLPSGNLRGLFSARVETTNGTNIVALVNEEDRNNGRLASYSGFVSGATTAYAPVVLKDYFGYFSSITVQNVGNTVADITVQYSNGTSETVQSVAPGNSVLFFQPNDSGLPEGFNGSAILMSSQPIVAIVNENTNRSIGDDLLAYNAFGKQPPTETPTATATPTATHTPTPTATGTSTPTATPISPTTFYATSDATVIQAFPTNNFGSTADLWVGYDHCAGAQMTRGLVQFDVSAIPPGTQIDQAMLWLYLISSCDIGERTHTVTVYRSSGAWTESAVTWDTQPGYNEEYGSTSIPSQNWGWYSFDVTDLVRGWVNGIFPNHGLIVRGPESPGSDSARLGFYAREQDGTNLDPYIEITHTQ